ncbi:TIM barrel protein, partial [Labrenzia sp. DG1229]|uniref:TIM barrel protein n=1 Tax=Labrenzia sp. DG1229 TaxID=681847 RepID=UPI00056668B0
MPRFSANISMMFTEYDFLDRFAAAQAAGFKAVEFLFPYDFSPQQIGECLFQHGLSVSVFNLPPGNWETGERGIAALPGREDEFRAAVETALSFATEVRAERLHVMAGI